MSTIWIDIFILLSGSAKAKGKEQLGEVSYHWPERLHASLSRASSFLPLKEKREISEFAEKENK